MAAFRSWLPSLKYPRALTVVECFRQSIASTVRLIYKNIQMVSIYSYPQYNQRLATFAQILEFVSTRQKPCLGFLSPRIGLRTHPFQSTLTRATNENYHLIASTNISALPAKPARKISQSTVYQYLRPRHRLHHLIILSLRRRIVPRLDN
jgi:hypothetical protein